MTTEAFDNGIVVSLQQQAIWEESRSKSPDYVSIEDNDGLEGLRADLCMSCQPQSSAEDSQLKYATYLEYCSLLANFHRYS